MSEREQVTGAGRKLLNKKWKDLKCVPGQSVCHAWRSVAMHVGIWWVNLKKRVQLKELRRD